MARSLLTLNVDIDRAIRFLAEYLPQSDETSRKPILPHNIRVGMKLYECSFERGYRKEVILAGFLHDTLEWSGANEDALYRVFGRDIVRLVQANTKDDTIEDGKEKTKELVERCARAGQEALLIKTADILDSFQWYTAMENEGELEYCRRNAEEIFKNRDEHWHDPLFEELQKWHNYEKMDIWGK